jgi:hypothetical protein
MRFGINFEEGTPPDEPMWPPAPAWALATVRTFGQAWRGTPGYRSFLRRRIVRLAGGSPETPETASLSSLVGDRVAVIDLFRRLHEELGCGFSSQSWVRAADAETLGDVVGFFAAQEPWESQGDR